MRVTVGLGNPGAEYANTRHNVGFVVVDELVRRQNLLFKPMKKLQAEVAGTAKTGLLIKPQTFMNHSGQAVRAVYDYFSSEPLSPDQLKQLYVIHDDLDLEFGQYKIQLGTGPKIHNGLLSLYQHLGSKDFWHVRVGVDGRQGDRSISGKDYVLLPFTSQEQAQLDQTVAAVAADLQSRLD